MELVFFGISYSQTEEFSQAEVDCKVPLTRLHLSGTGGVTPLQFYPFLCLREGHLRKKF